MVSAVVHHYWAFLSYSSDDIASAKWVHKVLERYFVPRRLVGTATPAGPAPRRFRPIFRDRAELPADFDLGSRIQNALQLSAYLIVICSPRSAASRWVDEEIVQFSAVHGDARILTIIVDGSPSGANQECFPPSLRYRENATAVERRGQPIAADLRPGRDGRRMAKLKLVAGMLGVGLDELVRRDAQRRQRQLVAITAAALAGTVAMGVLATAAIISRNEAQRQRAQAEGLIEFMLTDLRKKLEPAGKLDAMDGAGREALKYYALQDQAALDAKSLARRARALRLMGEIGIQRGDLEEALKSFQQASVTTRELLARSPDDGPSIFNHAQNTFWVGEIAHQRGNIPMAEGSFKGYRELTERLITIDPSNEEWRAEVAYSESALGVLFLEQGRIKEAIVSFKRSLQVADELAKRKPDDPSRQLELGQGYAWLADALQKEGHLVAARRYRETELAIYRSILVKDPTVRQAKFSSIIALQVLGRIAVIGSDSGAALVDFVDSAKQAEALLLTERENMVLTGAVAIAQVDMGEALLAAGQPIAASKAQQRAEDLINVALAHDDSVALWHDYQDRETLLKAAVAAQAGGSARALEINHGVLTRLETRHEIRTNTEPFILLQQSRLQTGESLASMNRTTEANERWMDIVNTLTDPMDFYDPRLLLVVKAAELRLNRQSAAQAIAERLRDMYSVDPDT